MSNTPLTPEQQASADQCDQMTDAVLLAVQGVRVGVVVGMCLNVLDRSSDYLPADLRAKLAERMRQAADNIEAKQDAPEPGAEIH